MEEVDKHWLAAAIDGEGSVSIHWKKRKDGSRRPFPYIGVCNSYKEFLEKVKRIIGSGGISEKQKGVNFPLYNWCTTDQIVILNTLKEIRDLLIVKAKNADIVIEFLEKKKEGVILVPKITESLKRNQYGLVDDSVRNTSYTIGKGNRMTSTEQRRINAINSTSAEANARKGNKITSAEERSLKIKNYIALHGSGKEVILEILNKKDWQEKEKEKF